MLPSSVLKALAEQTAHLFGVMERRFEQQMGLHAARMELQSARFDSFLAESRQQFAEQTSAEREQRMDAAELLRDLERRGDEIMAEARSAAEETARQLRHEAEQTSAQLRADASLTAERLFKAVNDRVAEISDGEPGPQGLPGEQGPPGPQGERGESGPQGDEGPMGIHGVEGPQGLPGPAGERGERGLEGIPGPRGERGEAGEPGPIGERGEAGPQGEAGPVGLQGWRGERGETGPIGETGPRGERGEAGPMAEMRAATRWTEGAVYYGGNLATHKGSLWQACCDTAREPGAEGGEWFLVAAAGRDGRDAPEGEVCGLFDEHRVYKKFDLVTLNGSEFRAIEDNPGKCPGDGWRISAQVGKRGEKGLPGERGPQGPRGTSGAIKAWEIEAPTFRAIPVAEDGKPGAPLDIHPLLQQFLDETR